MTKDEDLNNGTMPETSVNGQTQESISENHQNSDMQPERISQESHPNPAQNPTTDTMPVRISQGNRWEKLKTSVKLARSRVIVEPVILLYFLAKGPLGPILQQYVYAEVAKRHGISDNEVQGNCSANKSDPYFILQQSIQREASNWSILFSACNLIPSIVTTIFLGSYSETVGRKIALITPLFGTILMAMFDLTIIGLGMDFRYIVIGGFIEGISGGTAAVLMAAFAFIGDTNEPKKRTIRLFYMELAQGIGMSVSLLLSGYMIKNLGFTWSVLIVEAIFTLCFVVVLTHVPEGIQNVNANITHTKTFQWRDVAKVFKLYTKDTETKRRGQLQLSLSVLFLTQLVNQGAKGDVTTYFLLNTPLCFDSVKIGFQLGVTIFFKFTGSVLFLKLFYRKLRDLKSIFVSCVSGFISQGIMAIAVTAVLTFISPVFGSLDAISIALMRSYLSKLVTDKEQGALFASVALTEQTCALVGQALFNVIYANTVSWYSGFVFCVSAFFFLIAIILSWIMIYKGPKHNPPLHEDNNTSYNTNESNPNMSQC